MDEMTSMPFSMLELNYLVSLDLLLEAELGFFLSSIGPSSGPKGQFVLACWDPRVRQIKSAWPMRPKKKWNIFILNFIHVQTLSLGVKSIRIQLGRGFFNIMLTLGGK